MDGSSLLQKEARRDFLWLEGRLQNSIDWERERLVDVDPDICLGTDF